MRFTKEATEPIREYLLETRKFLASMPKDEVPKAMKELQDRIVSILKAQAAGDSPSVADVRRAIAVMPSPRDSAHAVQGKGWQPGPKPVAPWSDVSSPPPVPPLPAVRGAGIAPPVPAPPRSAPLPAAPAFVRNPLPARKRNSWLLWVSIAGGGALIVVLAVLWGIGRVGSFTGLGSSPIQSRDYCTILFAHKLFDDLELRPGQRVLVLMMEAKFVDGMKNLGLGDAQKSGEDALESSSRQVKDLLTPEQDGKFQKLYDSGKLMHVSIKVDVPGGPGSTGTWMVLYSRYKEDDASAKQWLQPPTEAEIAGQIQTAADAMDVAASGSGELRARSQGIAFNWLCNAPVDSSKRAWVCSELKSLLCAKPACSHLKEAGQAYCRWAGQEQTAELLAMLADGSLGESRAAALQKLIETDPTALEKWMTSHARDVFVEVALASLSNKLPQDQLDRFLSIWRTRDAPVNSGRPPGPFDPLAAQTADYCTLLFARQLQDDLGISVPTRIELILLTRKMTAALDQFAGRPFGLRCDESILEWGRTVKSALQPDQAAKFESLFRERRMEHVAFVPVQGSNAFALRYTAGKDGESAPRVTAEQVGNTFQVKMSKEFDPAGEVHSAAAALELATAGSRLGVDIAQVALHYLAAAEVDAAVREDVRRKLGAILPGRWNQSPDMIRAYVHWTTKEEVPGEMALLKSRQMAEKQAVLRGLLAAFAPEVEQYVKDHDRDIDIESTLQFIAWDSCPEKAQAERVRGISLAKMAPHMPGVPGVPPAHDGEITDLKSALTALAAQDYWKIDRAVRWLAAHPRKDKVDIAKVHDALKPMLADNKRANYDSLMAVFVDYAAKDDIALLSDAVAADQAGRSGSNGAVMALIKLAPKAGRDAIEKNGGNFLFRTGLLASLSLLDSSFEKELWPLLGSAHLEVREVIYQVLGKIGTLKSLAPMNNAFSRMNRTDKTVLKRVAEQAVSDIRARQKH